MLRAMECIIENRKEKAKNWLDKQMTLIDDCCQDMRNQFKDEMQSKMLDAKRDLLARIANDFRKLSLASDPSVKQYVMRDPAKQIIYDQLKEIGKNGKKRKNGRSELEGVKMKSTSFKVQEMDASQILKEAGLSNSILWTDGMIYYKGLELYVGDSVILIHQSRPEDLLSMRVLDISKYKAIMQEDEQEFVTEITPEELADEVYTIIK